MLTPSQIELLRSSAEHFGETGFEATNAFYGKLFQVAPAVRPLFPEDMYAQSEKLWRSIVMVVESADDLTQIEAELKALGARHVGYGAKPAHYEVVSDVLIQTISNYLKGTWTKETEEAWKEALAAVGSTMLEGAAQRAG